jgi:hypothetical protein
MTMNKIAITDTVRAEYMATAKAVWEENGKGTYGQDMDTVTKLRVIKTLVPAATTKERGGKLTPEEYGKLVQLMKVGSNAHAINVELNQLGGAAKKAVLSTEYANLG